MPVKSLLSPQTETMLNEAFAAELNAAYLYRHVAIQLKRAGWRGAASYFAAESHEEGEHATRLSDYMDGRGSMAEVPQIDAPDEPVEDLRDAVEVAYATEVELEASYVKWYGACKCETTKQFLLGFLSEQRASVSKYSDLIARLDAIENDKCAMLMLDKEMAV